AEIIRSHVAWAQELAAMIDLEPDFERSAPTPFSTVCFRYKGSNEENMALLGRVNTSVEVFLSHTKVFGKTVLHLAIGNRTTSSPQVMRAWELVKQAAATSES